MKLRVQLLLVSTARGLRPSFPGTCHWAAALSRVPPAPASLATSVVRDRPVVVPLWVCFNLLDAQLSHQEVLAGTEVSGGEGKETVPNATLSPPQ